MDDDQKRKFSEYARLKTEEGAIKERLAELAPELQEYMEELGDDPKIETELGNFSLRKTKSWTYPEAIVVAEDNLKTAKKQAQSNGDATYELTPSLSFYRKRL